jgi:hypothetical protein
VQFEEFIGDSADNGKNPRFGTTGNACEKRNGIRKYMLVVQTLSRQQNIFAGPGSYNDTHLSNLSFARPMSWSLAGPRQSMEGENPAQSAEGRGRQ